ncbi:MAG: tail fiber domain-containing protein [Saprospiraceae bacterium]|nr:tail fiber domain-containing protein [Saprospiraceae bacterium]
MRSIRLTVFLIVLVNSAFGQRSIGLDHSNIKLSLIEDDGSRAVEICGNEQFQKNSIRLYNKDSLLLVGTFDDFRFGAYLGLYAREENLTLEMIADGTAPFTEDSAFGQIRFWGESNPTAFPIPGTPGPFRPFLFLLNSSQGQSWSIGVQGHSRGIFPNNFTETELVFQYNTGEVANIDENGVYTTVSDIKYKRNIESLGGVLSKLMQINPSSYHMSRSPNTGRSFGFIAQNIRDYFPELVKERGQDHDTYLMMNYSGMIPVTVKAIQELREIIFEQENEICDLRRLLQSMSKRIEQLEGDG